MILRVINHPYEFDMKNLCITFFPHEKIRLEGEEDPVVVTTRRETDGSFFGLPRYTMCTGRQQPSRNRQTRSTWCCPLPFIGCLAVY